MPLALEAKYLNRFLVETCFMLDSLQRCIRQTASKTKSALRSRLFLYTQGDATESSNLYSLLFYYAMCLLRRDHLIGGELHVSNKPKLD